jgi:hypothetical protein
VGGKVVNSSVLLPTGGAHGTHAGRYLIAPSHTDARLGLCAVLTVVRPAAVTIDFSTSPARNALAEVTIDFLKSPAVNSLAAFRPGNAVTITRVHHAWFERSDGGDLDRRGRIPRHRRVAWKTAAAAIRTTLSRGATP